MMLILLKYEVICRVLINLSEKDLEVLSSLS